MSPTDKKALIVGCARDCAPSLPAVLANVERLAGSFRECAIVFIENDSRDATKEILRRWCDGRTNARTVALDGLASACSLRTVRLAVARNRYLDIARTEFSHFDYLIALDCDDVNAMPLNLDAARRAIEFLETDRAFAGAFGNAKGSYYDMWALRHPTLCPRDPWEEVCDHALSQGTTDDEAFRQTFAKRIFRLAPDSPPLEVESAFGGLGIYKMSAVVRNLRGYVGYKTKRIAARSPEANGIQTREFVWQCCEHVSFHKGLLDQGGRLFVAAGLMNCDTTGWSFAPAFWRTMLVDPRTLSPGTLAPAIAPVE